jgi:hypothetical protein
MTFKEGMKNNLAADYANAGSANREATSEIAVDSTNRLVLKWPKPIPQLSISTSFKTIPLSFDPCLMMVPIVGCRHSELGRNVARTTVPRERCAAVPV